jgi:hypothetical protein
MFVQTKALARFLGHRRWPRGLENESKTKAKDMNRRERGNGEQWPGEPTHGA